MAVEKKKYADQQNIRVAAETILKATNTRIKERILTTSDYATDNANVTHVLSAKALYDLLGNIAAYATDDGTNNTFISKIKALDLAIGTTEDTATDETVYGAIAAVNERISGLTHLTYQLVQGPITTAVPLADAEEDVIYLQKNNDSYSIGRDGFLLDTNGAVAEAGEEGSEYSAYYNPGLSKYFKADKVDGAYVVSNVELTSDDELFDNVAMIPDNTYTLYVCQITEENGERTGIQWIEVGNTDITLTDYVSKSDYDIKEVQERIMERIPDQTIIDQIQAAFNATDPYGVNAATTSYLDSWLPQPAADPDPEP